MRGAPEAFQAKLDEIARGDWDGIAEDYKRLPGDVLRYNLAMLEGFAATPNGLINVGARPITDAASNDLYNLGIGTDVSPEENRERNNQFVGTVGGVASMFAGKLPTKVPRIRLDVKALPELRSPFDMSGGRSALNIRRPYNPGDLTSHPNAHAFPVHDGGVTDAELIIRSRTGVKPGLDKDGEVVTGPIPEMSSAFHSDDYLRWVDETIHKSGALKAAAARQPGQSRISVDVQDVGDLGVDLGRGYKRIWHTGNKERNLTVHGPSQRVDGLRSATGYYELNPLHGRWENISLFPQIYK